MSKVPDNATDDTVKAHQILAELRTSNQRIDQEIAESLKSIEDTDVKRIPINVFEEIFLPFITGEVQSTNEQNYIDHWVGLVGQSNAAEICDIQGKTLFTVPPFVDTSVIDVTRESRLSSVMTNYSNDASINPARAQGELAVGLAKELEKTIVGESKHGWESMFAYYGIEDKKKQNEVKPANLNDDFIDD